MPFLSSVSFSSIQRFAKDNLESVIVAGSSFALISYSRNFGEGFYGVIGYTVAKTLRVAKNRFFSSAHSHRDSSNAYENQEIIRAQAVASQVQTGSRFSRFVKNHFKSLSVLSGIVVLSSYDYRLGVYGVLGYTIDSVAEVAKNKFSNLFSLYNRNVKLQEELQKYQDDNAVLLTENEDLTQKNQRQSQELLLLRGFAEGVNAEKRVSSAQECIIAQESMISLLQKQLKEFTSNPRRRQVLVDEGELKELKADLEKLELRNKTLLQKNSRLEEKKKELDETLKKQEALLFRPMSMAETAQGPAALQKTLHEYQRKNTVLEKENSELVDENDSLRETISRLNALIEGYKKGFNNKALRRNITAIDEIKTLLLRLHPEIRKDEEIGRTLNPVEQIDAKAAASVIKREFSEMVQDLQESFKIFQDLLTRITSVIPADESDNVVRADSPQEVSDDLSNSEDELDNNVKNKSPQDVSDLSISEDDSS